MKLSLYGIEIYAAIDGYSRYILWVYIGISTRTAISVYKQYINVVSTFRYLPQVSLYTILSIPRILLNKISDSSY